MIRSPNDNMASDMDVGGGGICLGKYHNFILKFKFNGTERHHKRSLGGTGIIYQILFLLAHNLAKIFGIYVCSEYWSRGSLNIIMCLLPIYKYQRAFEKSYVRS